MKRYLALALTLICALSLAVSCNKPETDPTPDPSINIDSPSVLVPAGENTAVLTFTANNDWTVVSSESWCTVSPSSGKASENAAVVQITLEPNTTGETRTAKITVKAGGIEKQVNVTQAPEEVKPEDIIINYIWNNQDDTQINDRHIQARYQCAFRDGGRHHYDANVKVSFKRIAGVIPDLVIAPEADMADWVEQEYEVYYNEYNDTYDVCFSVGRNPGHEPRTGHFRISTRDGQYSSEVITVDQTGIPEHAVDLGLSCYWHEFNLGANSPEEYGDYYAWGELAPKTTYTWDTYNCAGGDRYTTYSGGSYTYCLYDEDDAVIQKLNPNGSARFGAYWQMPTTYDFEDLIATQSQTDTYKWEWKEVNGHNGWQITYLVNGKSIFLPSAGVIDGEELKLAESVGLYWSSYPVPYVPQMAYYLRIEPGPYWEAAIFSNGERAHGMPIRPVTY